MHPTPIALIVAGPTCSGKSALAFSLAKTFGGHIINADSMQVYNDLRILTARPSLEEEQAVPHRMYGVMDAADNGSVAWWRQHALTALHEAFTQNKLPIFCGGTGLYLRALVDGLVEVPDPGAEARHAARLKLAQEGAPALHRALQAIDPDSIAKVAPSDGQRLARLWEVWQGTGQTLSWWQRHGRLPPAPCRFIAIQIDPPRDKLRTAITARFHDMMEQGALAEVAALQARNLSPQLPAMRAHGVPELIAYLEGLHTRDCAIAKATLATGQYTRRQATWFRHHILAAPFDRKIILQRYGVEEQLYEKINEDLEIFLRERLTS